jgi:hypothetical protein
MLCNLWHIKQTNGLYYYSLDYLRAVKPRMPVLVRPALLEGARRALPGHDVQAVSALGLMTRLLGAALSGRWVFTPTSHPFPLLRRQVIVIHDNYPFVGPRGDLKRRLFLALLAMSRCQVGHINHSSALSAVPDDLVPADRYWYVPNLGPHDAEIEALRQRRQAREPSSDPVRVALFGTDSRKKRYEMLFEAVRQAGVGNRLVFVAFGHATQYYQELKATFPDLSIELTLSSESAMEEFLGDARCVVSVAEHEGFGRPVALALAAGIPCFLLQSPVFEEFFGQSTVLYPSVDALVAALVQSPASWLPPAQAGPFVELPQIRAAFHIAIDRFNQLAVEQGVAS